MSIRANGRIHWLWGGGLPHADNLRRIGFCRVVWSIITPRGYPLAGVWYVVQSLLEDARSRDFPDATCTRPTIPETYLTMATAQPCCGSSWYGFNGGQLPWSANGAASMAIFVTHSRRNIYAVMVA